ncbi:MAG: glycerol kinase GlpK [Pseudomonadota bacterium]
MTKQYILSIDQGTTSSRAIVFDQSLQAVASAQQEFSQHFPASGWVEHDAEEIWASVVAVCREALASANLDASDIAAIGITNQRETTIVWDRETGKPISRAIVWQDRRTAEICRELARAGHADTVAEKTGLRLDPYFSATKVAWILDHTAGARERAQRGELAFGTVDSFVLWHLTNGEVHATDVTNASRTALYDISAQQFCPELLEIFRVPANMMPDVRDCAADFGVTDPALFGAAIPVAGIAGDQQAALIGQGCFAPGETKSTYGTGCFVIANTGDEILRSSHQLLTTIGYRIAGKTTYALEGSIFVAGSAIQWLRDGVRLFDDASETGDIASEHGVEKDVYVVPAFTGLGAPYWDPDARGAVYGITRGTTREALVTATLQSIAYQTWDLVGAMRDDGVAPGTIRVDGGMVSNDWFLQFLADVCGCDIRRPTNTESTVLGAAMLAALQCGWFTSLADVQSALAEDRTFSPSMAAADVESLVGGWVDAVRRTRVSA